MTPWQAIEAWFERVWNRGDAGHIDVGLAPDAVLTGLAAETIRGPTDFRAFYAQINAAFDGIATRLGDFIETGNRFAGFVHVTATHRASRKKVAFDSFFIGAVKDGKIVSAHNLTDFLTVMVETGALPADALDSALAGKPIRFS